MVNLPKFTMLLALMPIADIMDKDEGKEAISLIALFESQDEADYMRLGIANIMPHETRLVNITVDTEQQVTVTDVMVVIKDSVN